jgi:hypothetical protein
MTLCRNVALIFVRFDNIIDIDCLNAAYDAPTLISVLVGKGGFLGLHCLHRNCSEFACYAPL